MTEEEIQATYSVQFSSLDEQILQLESELYRHQFLSGDRQHVVVHLLALRLIELARGCRLLAKAGLAAANASLGRQCLEVGFKLKAICNGKATPEDFFNQEIISREKSRSWVLKNPSALAVLSPELRDSLHQESQEASGKKLKEIKPYEWAERAEEVEVHLFAYSTLSDFVHSGPVSLGHIFDVKSNGQIYMQTGPSDYLIDSVIEGTCHCLASSANAIQKMFCDDPSAAPAQKASP
ncbi:MAG: DUF5677 domain-containing protein [Polaromonas sp.]